MSAHENPYAAPELIEQIVVARIDEPTAQEMFIAWEKLRLIYNGTLALVAVVFGLALRPHPQFIDVVLQGAFIANVCFCIGPILEGYATLLGIPRRVSRTGFFVLGTAFASLLAVFALAGG